MEKLWRLALDVKASLSESEFHTLMEDAPATFFTDCLHVSNKDGRVTLSEFVAGFATMIRQYPANQRNVAQVDQLVQDVWPKWAAFARPPSRATHTKMEARALRHNPEALLKAHGRRFGSAACCPDGHGLTSYVTDMGGYSCSQCDDVFPMHTTMFACRICDYDVCESCRANLVEEAEAATKLQAVARGRAARKRLRPAGYAVVIATDAIRVTPAAGVTMHGAGTDDTKKPKKPKKTKKSKKKSEEKERKSEEKGGLKSGFLNEQSEKSKKKNRKKKRKLLAHIEKARDLRAHPSSRVLRDRRRLVGQPTPACVPPLGPFCRATPRCCPCRTRP